MGARSSAAVVMSRSICLRAIAYSELGLLPRPRRVRFPCLRTIFSDSHAKECACHEVNEPKPGRPLSVTAFPAPWRLILALLFVVLVLALLVAIDTYVAREVRSEERRVGKDESAEGGRRRR